MKKYILLVIILLVVLGGYYTYQKTAPGREYARRIAAVQNPQQIRLIKEDLINLDKYMRELNEKNYHTVYEVMSPGYQKTLTEQDFMEALKGLDKLGSYQKTDLVKLTRDNKLMYYYVKSTYQKGVADFKLYLEKGLLNGFEYTITMNQ